MRLATSALALALVAGAAFAGSESKEATNTMLLTEPLHGMEGKVLNAVRIDIPPGWETPRHTHPGNVVVYVLEGEIEIELAGGETHTLTAGEVVYEAPDQPMVGRNASSSQGARILVFQVGDEGAPLTVAQE